MACCLGQRKVASFDGFPPLPVTMHSKADGQKIDASIQPSQDMHGFCIRGNSSLLSRYFVWQKTYSNKQSSRATRWSALMKRMQGSSFTPSSELKILVRKGVPNGLRGQVWMDLSGAAKRMADNPGLYQKHLDGAEDGASHGVLSQIELDLHRTFPDHPHFSRQQLLPAATEGGNVSQSEENLVETQHVQSLRRVLRAYACRNAIVGYCQGMNFIAGIMLLFLNEECAYWLLASLLETILPPDYYATDLIGCNVDLRVFSDLLGQKLPKVSKALVSAGIGVEFFALEWFIAMFSKTLPSETVLRIWDCIFSEGDKILFRVGLGILRMSENEIVATSDVLQMVQGLGRELLDVELLLKTSFAFYVKRENILVARARFRAEVERERQIRLDRAQALAPAPLR